MGPITLQQVVDCPGATIRNDALQPASDPILTLTLKAQDGQIYLLPGSGATGAGLHAGPDKPNPSVTPVAWQSFT
jgi:hypothetical protein